MKERVTKLPGELLTVPGSGSGFVAGGMERNLQIVGFLSTADAVLLPQT